MTIIFVIYNVGMWIATYITYTQLRDVMSAPW